MIHLITGDFGSGKSSSLAAAIAADVAAARPSCLLVPEQQTVLTEQSMADLLPPAAPLCFEVSNFTRLANTVFRRVGGLSYRYAGPAARTLVMWRAMGELLPLLHEKGGEQEGGRVRKMTAAMAELSALSLRPAQLSSVAGRLPQGSHLRDKLEDLSLLSTLYHALLQEGYGDVADDLDRLCTLLQEDKTLLDGLHLYVDGFISFTEQEWQILRAFGGRGDLTVTLTLPDGREGEMTYAETADTAARFEQLAAQQGIPFLRTDLGASKRAAAPRLRAALSALFSPDEEKPDPVWPQEGEDLRILAAKDPFAEAEFVAADIARRVQAGAHYRDFAILARRAEAYAGVLDVCLEDADIPFFMAKKTDVSSLRAIKLIYAAYAVCTGNWRGQDVISYVKCGMTTLPQEACDAFEMYVTRWKIHGRRFTDPEPWNMNPDGYTDRLTPRGADLLQQVEAVRTCLVAQLLPLAEGCVRQSVPAHCRTLYTFLTSLRVEEQLLEEAQAARAAGRLAEGEELSRLYATLLSGLDELAAVLAEVTVSAEQFVDLLRLLLSEVQLSKIPTAVDEVTVGSADLLRLHEPRHVYLLGVNEGVFPAAVADDSIFSEGDRRILQENGLPVAPDLCLRAAREYFCFARAFAAGGESVTVLYAQQKLSGERQKPAAVIERLAAFAPVHELPSVQQDPLSLLWRPAAASRYLGLLHGSVAGEALANTLRDHGYARTVEGLDIPLAQADCTLSQETAAALSHNGLALTQSRLDRYVRCPFSYFCSYILRLDPCRVIDFDYSDIGNLLHAVLERFFAVLEERSLSIRELDAAMRAGLVREVCEAYILRICPAEQQRTPRLRHLFSKLQRMAGLLIDELYEELCQSDFVPRFFELDMAEEGADAPGSMEFTLPNGQPIRIFGRIDRVDVWKKGSKTYLRVIDYKSGPKDFSLADVEKGLDTQLLLYLFSLWKSQNPAFRRLLCEEGGEILPAGVLYTAARTQEQVYDSPPAPGEAEAAARRSLRRSGLLLDDKEVLFAMDQTRKGRYIPVRFRADGGVYQGCERSLASLSRMGELVGVLERTITRIGAEIASGQASARPIAAKNRAHICEYCEMKAVCRSSSLG